MLVLDENLKVLSANNSFYKFFEVDKKETEGKRIYELGDNQWDIPKLRELLDTILPQNAHFDDYEVEYDSPTIGHKIMLLNARKFNQDGEHILLAFEDFTSKGKIDRKKDNFISIASHELKIPVTSIITYMQLLPYVSKIEKQLNRLSTLITDLLDVGKIKRDKLLLNKKMISIDDTVKEVIAIFQLSVDSHSIELTGTARKKIYADKDRIEQVLTNLIANAVKYSPESNKICISISSDNDSITVTVKDSGIGMTKEEQEHIFDPFYRAKKADQGSFSGLGLGLHIAKDIVKQHDGKLEVESNKGQGTTFSLSLPVTIERTEPNASFLSNQRP